MPSLSSSATSSLPLRFGPDPAPVHPFTCGCNHFFKAKTNPLLLDKEVAGSRGSPPLGVTGVLAFSASLVFGPSACFPSIEPSAISAKTGEICLVENPFHRRPTAHVGGA